MRYVRAADPVPPSEQPPYTLVSERLFGANSYCIPLMGASNLADAQWKAREILSKWRAGGMEIRKGDDGAWYGYKREYGVPVRVRLTIVPSAELLS